MKPKMIALAKFTKIKSMPYLSETSVIMDKNRNPQGFVFGRNAFITMLEHIDGEFEKRVTDQKKYFDNPAGKLIDAIESKLPLNEDFVNKLKLIISTTNKSDYISIDEIMKNIHV